MSGQLALGIIICQMKERADEGNRTEFVRLICQMKEIGQNSELREAYLPRALRNSEKNIEYKKFVRTMTVFLIVPKCFWKLASDPTNDTKSVNK